MKHAQAKAEREVEIQVRVDSAAILSSPRADGRDALEQGSDSS